MKDIDLALFTGVDIPLPELQLTLHQPSINEISMIGEKAFLSGIQNLCIDKKLFERDRKDLSNTTNFQIFMTIMQEKEAKDIKDYVKDALSLILPNSKLMITPRALLLNYNGSNIIIDEGNFEDFQKILRQVFCLKNEDEDFNPANDAAAKIAEKIKKGRARVAHIKGEDVGSIYAKYVSILSVGLRIPISVLNKYTVYQLNDQLERYYLWSNWDIDIRSRLAGAKADSKPEDWTRNIHKD